MSARSTRPLWDAGAQAERTALSWNRTALAVAAVLMLLVRAGASTPAVGVFVFGMLAVGGLVLLPVVRYRRIVDRLATQAALPGPAPLATLAVAVALTGCGALVVLVATGLNRTG